MRPFHFITGLTLAFFAVACTPPAREPSAQGQASLPDGGRVVGRYDGGVVTEEELLAESSRLPSPLREQFEGPNGRHEFVRSMIDKRLLAQEASARGLHEKPEIQKQVRALEERLMLQALLAEEERAAGAPSEAELHAWYEGHLSELTQPERVRVVRIFAAMPAGASATQRTQARQRAERFAQQLQAGQPRAKVAAGGDGPERAQGGELGLLARGDWRGDAAVEKAAFALKKVGEVSPVVTEMGGFLVLQLLERREARVPPFEEVRAEVEARMLPQRKRKVFEDLLERLRRAGAIEIDVAGRP
ncbi:peptidylprolyl isomerase [Pyxidicoccus caerfyrddinensis]|uniref:peptidylprolyl isomerase n=1 Tax=Pyxidicoccus caerfyrddinensis TaxID=2709663 RepID=UPI0013DC4CC5|nr:peptidylprolyl isomerase [Pyxidicoccus caerfyrddinensis]